MGIVTGDSCSSFGVSFSVPVQADSGFTFSVKKKKILTVREEEGGPSPASPSLLEPWGVLEEWRPSADFSGPHKLTKACYSWLLLHTTLRLWLQPIPPFCVRPQNKPALQPPAVSSQAGPGSHIPTGAEGARRPLSHPSVNGAHSSECLR